MHLKYVEKVRLQLQKFIKMALVPLFINLFFFDD